MPTPITLRIGPLELTGQLNDSPTARALAVLLPLKVRMARWGDEYYGALDKPLRGAEAPDAREDMAVGELAYWPPPHPAAPWSGCAPARRQRSVVSSCPRRRHTVVFYFSLIA